MTYLSYMNKVYEASPITHLALIEDTGSVAYDYSGNPCHSAYTGVTLASYGGIFDLASAPSFTGSSRVSLSSGDILAWTSLWSSTNGTIIGWARTDTAGRWTDGVGRYVFRILNDASNQIYLYKGSGSNVLTFYQSKAGTAYTQNATGLSIGTSWFSFCVTWSNNVTEFFLNDSVVQSYIFTSTMVGTPTTHSNIGAGNTAFANPWLGSVQSFQYYNSKFTFAEYTDLRDVALKEATSYTAPITPKYLGDQLY